MRKMIPQKIYKDLQAIRLRPKNRGLYIWEEFMKKYKCNIICELGVCKGENFSEMIKHNPKVAVAVDAWVNDGVVSRNDAAQAVLDQQYANFVKEMSDKPFVKIYREYSFNAVKHFKDNYFDLIYIDADHSYEGCFRDINDWYPKVKKGRFLLGDDYRIYEGKRPGIKFGVIEAVRDFTKRNNLKFLELPSYGWGIIKR